MPPGPVGVPWRVAVPLPMSLKVTPVGSGPVSVMLGVGTPVVVTVKKEVRPNTKVVVLPLVMVGAVWATAVSTKDAVANPMAAKRQSGAPPMRQGATSRTTCAVRHAWQRTGQTQSEFAFANSPSTHAQSATPSPNGGLRWHHAA